MVGKLEKNAGPQAKLTPKPSAPAAHPLKAPPKGKLGRDEMSTGKGRALTLKAELAAAPRTVGAKPRGRLAPDELSTGQGRALRGANEKSLPPLADGGSVARQSLRELELSLHAKHKSSAPRAGLRAELAELAKAKLSGQRLLQVAKRERLFGAQLAQLVKKGKLSGAELAQLTKLGKHSKAELAGLAKNGKLSGAELDMLAKTKKLSGAELAQLTKHGKLSAAELAALTKHGKLSPAELGLLTRSGKLSAAELAQLTRQGRQPAAELAALTNSFKLLGPDALGKSSLAPDPALSPEARKAAQKVTQAYETGGAEAAANELDRQVIALSAADAKAVYAAVSATIDKIVADVDSLGQDAACQTITSLSEAARLAGADAVKDLGKRFATLVPDGSVGDWDNGFSASIAAGAGPEVALATAEALRAMGKTDGAEDIESAVVDGVDRLQSKVKDSAAKKAELDARLAQDMAQFGGTMSPEDRKAYAEAFWALPDHAAAKAAADDSSGDLDHTMTVAGPKLESLARAGNVGAAATLLNSYEQLAKFPAYAEAAITWAGWIGNDAELCEGLNRANAFANGLDGGPGLEERLTNGLMTDGTLALQQQLLAEHAEDPDGQAKLLADYQRIYAGFKDAKMFVDLGKEVVKFLDQTKEVIEHPESIADIAAGWDDKSPFAKATAIASVVTGLYKTGKLAGEGKYLEAAVAALGTVDGGLGLTAGILAAYSGGAGRAADAARFIDKYAPVLSAVLDAIQLGKDAGELVHDPNAGELIKAIGSLVTLAGNAFPLLGGVLKVGGGIIHFIGGLIDSLIEGNAKKEKLTQEQVDLYVNATGIPRKLAEELVQTRAQTTDRLQALGFTTEQIAALAQQDGVDLSSSEAEVAIRAAAIFGLTAAETAEFLARTVNEGKFQYHGPLTDLAAIFFSPVSGQAEADRLLQDHDLTLVQQKMLEDLSYSNPELAEWIEAHQGPADYDVVFPVGLYED